jgi:hypothetical protein
MTAGSFRAWCKEDFSDRIKGRDYIVFVNRRLTKQGWSVDIAEIGTVLPVANDCTIASAHQERIYVHARATLMHSQRWFWIPGGERTDLKEIFRTAYERVFPGQWSSVGVHLLRHMSLMNRGLVMVRHPSTKLLRNFKRSQWNTGTILTDTQKHMLHPTL